MDCNRFKTPEQLKHETNFIVYDSSVIYYYSFTVSQCNCIFCRKSIALYVSVHDNIIAYSSCACYRSRRNGTANFDLRRNNSICSLHFCSWLTCAYVHSNQQIHTHKWNLYSEQVDVEMPTKKNRFIELAIWQVLSPRCRCLQIHSIVFGRINSFIETVRSQLGFWEHLLNLACNLFNSAQSYFINDIHIILKKSCQKNIFLD